MIILITYNKQQYLAKVTADHEVMLLGVENEELIDIKLDQCQECGIWLSEDDEMYHDDINDKSYCDGCSVYCEPCGNCFNRVNMSPNPDDDGMLICKNCKAVSG